MGGDSTRVTRKVYPRTSHVGGFAAIVASPAAIQAALSEQWNSFRTRPPIRGERDGQWTQHYYTDFPEQGPIQFRAAVAPSIPLWMVGVKAETNSFLPPDRLDKQRRRAFLQEFSEQHWFAAAIGPSIPLWAVGANAETNSFRSNAREKGNNRRLLTDFQNAGWALRGAGKLYDDGIWPAIELETRSYRLAEQPGKREEVRSRDKLRFYTDFPESGWVNYANVYTSDKWPAIDAQVKYDQRTAKRSNRWALWSWSNDLGWNSANIAPPFDPAIGWPANEQQLRSFRAGRELDRQILQRQARYGGFGTQIFDAAIWPAIEQLARSYEIRWRPGRPWFSPDQPNTDWQFTVFDATWLAAISQLVGERLGKGRGFFTADVPSVSWLTAVTGDIYDASRYPAIKQLIEWYRAGNRRYFTNEYIGADWIFQALPPDVYSALEWPGIQQLLDTYRGGRELNRTWLYQQARYGGFGTPVLQTIDPSLLDWVIKGERTIGRRGFPDQFISKWGGGAAILDVGAVHPALHQLLQSLRVSARTNQDWRRLLSDPSTAWLFAELYDPSRMSWAIGDARPGKRKYFTSDPPTIDWNFGRSDPVIVVPSQVQFQQFLMARRRLAPWISDPDWAWIFQNLPAPFDPAVFSWLMQDVRTGKAAGRPPWWNLDLDIGWIIANSPFPEPIPPPTILYQGDGKRRKRKKRRYDTQELLKAMERTIYDTLHSTTQTPPAIIEVQSVPATVDLSRGFEAALTELASQATEYRDLSIRIARLRLDVAAYEAMKREEDDEEGLLLL